MFEAYRIGIRLSLIDGASTALVGLASLFGSVHRQQLAAVGSLAEYEKRLQGIKRLGLIGGGMLGAGVVGFELLKKPLEEAAQFQKEVARFNALGLGEKTTRDAVQFAKGMNIMGQSSRDNLKLIREATSFMGDAEHAKLAAPMLSKMKFGIETVMGDGHADKFGDMFMASIKVAELRGQLVDRQTGQIDLAKFGAALDMMTKSYVGSGGLVTPRDYLAAIKTGGVATKLMSPEAFFYTLGHFMQESGGSRTGTATMSMFQNWEMGRMPQRIAEDMQKIGLLKTGSIHYGKTGHVNRVDADGIVQSQQFVDNPFTWVNKVAVPMLEKLGFHGDKLNLKLASLLGIRTASNLADQFVRDEQIALNYTARVKRADGIDSLYKEAAGTMQGHESDLTAKWSNLMLELGNTVLPIAIKGLEKLVMVLKAASDFAKANPELTKAIALTGVLIATLLTVGGAALLTTTALRGLGLMIQFLGIGGPAGIAKTAVALGLFGKGLGFVAAGLAGWEAGKYVGGKVYDHLLAGTSMGDAAGAAGAHFLAFFGNDEAKASIAARESLGSDNMRVKSASTQPRVIQIKLDSRVLAEAYDGHVNKVTGGGGARMSTQFDSNFSIPPLLTPSTK